MPDETDDLNRLVLSELHAGSASDKAPQTTTSQTIHHQSNQEALQSATTTTRFYLTDDLRHSGPGAPSDPASPTSDFPRGAGSTSSTAGPYSDSASGPDSSSDSDTELQPATKRRALATDSAGDLVLPRRRRGWRRRRRPPLAISIRHTAQPTPVADVGLQVWRGACLLCDWLLARPEPPPPGTLVLELGGGVGLVGVAAAAVANDVAVTDVHDGALGLAAANLAANASVVQQLRSLRRRRQRQPCDGAATGADCNQDGTGAADGRGLDPASAGSPFRSCRGGLDGGRGGGAVAAGTGPAPAAAAADPGVRLVGERPGSEAALEARTRAPAAAAATALAAATPAGRVHVNVCQLDWFDFLAYGSGSVTAEAIVQALWADTDADASRGRDARAGRDGGGARGGVPHMEEPSDTGETVAVVCGGRGMSRVLDAVAAAESLWLLAADTVYDTVLTEAFVKCAATLMSYHASVRQRMTRSRDGAAGAGALGSGDGGDGSSCSAGGGGDGGARLVVALEKRINFVLKDLAAGAPAFDDFMSYILVTEPPASGGSCGRVDAGGSGGAATGGGGGGGGLNAGGGGCLLQAVGGVPGPLQVAAVAVKGEPPAEGAPPDEREQRRRPLFRGRRLEVTAVPQVLRYDRSDQLELWELTLLA